MICSIICGMDGIPLEGANTPQRVGMCNTSTSLRRCLRRRRLCARRRGPRWLLSLAFARWSRRGTTSNHGLHCAPHCTPAHLALHCLLLLFEHPLKVLLVRADVRLFLLVLQLGLASLLLEIRGRNRGRLGL